MKRLRAAASVPVAGCPLALRDALGMVRWKWFPILGRKLGVMFRGFFQQSWLFLLLPLFIRMKWKTAQLFFLSAGKILQFWLCISS